MSPQGRPETDVLLNGTHSNEVVSLTDVLLPPRTAGPPMHRHDFDEAFYVLEGELVLQIDGERMTKGPGELGFALRNTAHTLANHSTAPARYLLVCTPAGFERHWAREAAEAVGEQPPPWALEPLPEVTVLGPPLPLPD